MKLRNKLLALSLLTLLLPWTAWKLLQELESFLRESQETALLASAQTLAGALPLEFRGRLRFASDNMIPLRPLPHSPVLDGYSDEWPEPDQPMNWTSQDGQLQVHLMAGESGGLLHFMFEVDDATPVRVQPGLGALEGDAVRLWLRTARGLQSWVVSPGAPGPISMSSTGPQAGELEGFWLERAYDPAANTRAGYNLELTLALAPSPGLELAFEVIDIDREGEQSVRRVGTTRQGHPREWLRLDPRWDGLADWLGSTIPESARAWLVDGEGWVLADSGGDRVEAGQTTWLQRFLYRLVSDERPRIETAWTELPVRLQLDAVEQALGGGQGSEWSQDLDNAVVRNTVAVPVVIEQAVRGALVLQARSDGLLLITNRALGQLLLTTLGLMLGLVAGLWYFASRLSRRVERLSDAVGRAMDRGVPLDDLPLTGDGDELGALARDNARLLKAVAEYNQYLQTLAGKLSHELKTPLAITRSSLDNLASLQLDDEARRFLERAREGLDRQGEIVRAMAEASRLEQAIESAEWNRTDLVALVTGCVEAYRAVHPHRQIEARVPETDFEVVCAPDLLAQALDKLVDNAVTISGPDDGVTVALKAVAGEARLSVINTGSRLPEALQDRLFDSLVSVRQHRGNEPHLGLGLYIVRLVAEAHGGTASARNLDAGDGVEFIIALPINA